MFFRKLVLQNSSHYEKILSTPLILFSGKVDRCVYNLYAVSYYRYDINDDEIHFEKGFIYTPH